MKGNTKTTNEKPFSVKQMANLNKFIKVLEKTSRDKPLTSDEILIKLNRNKRIHEWLTGVNLRAFTHYIRENGLLPLNTNNFGYYVSTDIDDIQDTYDLLIKKANSILAAAEALKANFLDNVKKPKSKTRKK